MNSAWPASVAELPSKADAPIGYLRSLQELFLAIRFQQWLKNLLIFVPAVTAHCFGAPGVFTRLSLASLSFSFCASAGYLVNDLLDTESDRHHPVKCRRAFASGSLSVRTGVLAVALLTLSAALIGNMVSSKYLYFLLAYLALSVTYSAFFKTLLLVDVFLLAFFYTYRIWMGGEAAGVPISFWLAAFSTFFFFSLAVMKRFIELRLCSADNQAVNRRDYRVEDAAMLGVWGPASGCAAVVVLALYINAEDILKLYSHPAYLWPICLAVLFWMSRIWMLANRNQVTHDPVLFAATDKTSYVVGGLMLLALFLAR